VRLYIPLTFIGLAGVLSEGCLTGPTSAFAVTPALREWYASGDTEELEFAAMTDAAEQSLRLLAADPSAPRRRVVMAADVADEQLAFAPDRHPAALDVTAAVALGDLASVHVDDPGAAATVAAAAAVVGAADAGDPDAAFLVDGLADHQLQWFAVQELPELLAAATT
jgi:hypothetical protein